MCSYDAADPPRFTIDQEARQERVFTTEPRDHQRPQAGEKGRERSRQRRNHHADSPNAVRRVFSQTTTFLKRRADRARRTLSRSSCRYWRRYRRNRSSANDNSRSGSCRGRVPLRAHRRFRLCQKSRLDRPPRNLGAFSVFPSISALTSWIPFVHHTIPLPPRLLGFFIYLPSCVSYDLI